MAAGAPTPGKPHSAPPEGRGRGGAGREGPQASDPLPRSSIPRRRPQPTEFEEEATRRVDDLLESYMGIRDPELGKGPG